MPFGIVFIEKNKVKLLISCKVREKITFIPLNKFLDSLGYIKKNVIWWLFNIKNLVENVLESTHI